ncbi:hypothetical protein [Paractinoplanes hotanensis]|uniref:Secreted protein n=1 Tax=Paractinoplanes hotanensis TaxID=2906497 RepID=A0ABT0YBM9_9ACTN|nr:hypothetical protein [Actinoplanes hotanensis]MCM4083452.1 hypothetical protein [Actinoplanes hotanensis]
MKISGVARRAVVGIVTTAVLTPAIVTAAAAPAVAAMGKGRAQICSQGDYPSQLEFAGTGGFSSFIAAAGTCVKVDIPAGTTRIDVVGSWSNGSTFNMGGFWASAQDNPGWKVYTFGSRANSAATASWRWNRD